MSVKKKFKLCKSNILESKSVDECVFEQYPVRSELTTANNDGNDTYSLSDLPNEVLLYIYQYLSPVDLLTVAELGNARLKELTFCIKEADFTLCHTSDPQRISAYFSRSRVKCIRKLKFNYTLYFKPHVLAQLISRCKSLTSLSIVECGIKFNHLIQILQNCCHLEELAWNVDEIIQLLSANADNMKTVYLFCDIKQVSLRSVFYIVRNFRHVADVWINFSSDAISELPFIGVWLKVSSVVNIATSKGFTLLTNSFQCISNADDLQFLRKIIDQSTELCIERVNSSLPVNVALHYFTTVSTIPMEKDGQNNGILENTFHSQTFMSPPYVQMLSTVEDISELLSGPCNAFSTLSIILTPEILHVSEGLLKSINEAFGAKLKHLSLQCDAYHSSRCAQTPLPISREESSVLCEILDEMFLTSKYITVLNLVTVHFSAGSPFKAISKLKFLKTLNIPSCAFRKKKVNDKKFSDAEHIEFKDVVENCLLVEKFSLVCCADDYMQFSDADLFPLKQWKELKHLTIYSMVFRTSSFLRKVADSCKKLKSLSLICVAPNNVCLFTTDVIYLLKVAKNLSFIRINDERFNPMYERFWDAIGEAVNLEGICIITQSRVAIEKQVIVKAIRKLKYLHLFHFFATRAPDRLYIEVKKSMNEHGVVNYRMENGCNINSFNSAASKQYYHHQPHFCCQHIHFRDYFF